MPGLFFVRVFSDGSSKAYLKFSTNGWNRGVVAKEQCTLVFVAYHTI